MNYFAKILLNSQLQNLPFNTQIEFTKTASHWERDFCSINRIPTAFLCTGQHSGTIIYHDDSFQQMKVEQLEEHLADLDAGSLWASGGPERRKHVFCVANLLFIYPLPWIIGLIWAAC